MTQTLIGQGIGGDPAPPSGSPWPQADPRMPSGARRDSNQFQPKRLGEVRMPHETTPGDEACPRAVTNEVECLAKQALATVVQRIASHPAHAEPHIVREMCRAMLDQDQPNCQSGFENLAATGVGTAEIYEVYLPAVAHMLGEYWMRDDITFVEVTDAAFRLQESVRFYGRQYAAAGLRLSNPHAILLCVPECEQHSLGAFMAAHHFRRLGLWVQLGIGFSGSDIVEATQRHRFSMIGFSAASKNSVEPLRKLIDNVRNALNDRTPIVIGGSIVQCGLDVAKATGADIATTDAREALLHCGILRELDSQEAV